jgi:transcriptional regulator with XRE-family HTH domain
MALSPGEQFGKNVRKARLKRGLSQEQLAEVADLHRTEISHIERSTRDIRLTTAVRVARALEIEPARLLHGIR